MSEDWKFVLSKTVFLLLPLLLLPVAADDDVVVDQVMQGNHKAYDVHKQLRIIVTPFTRLWQYPAL